MYNRRQIAEFFSIPNVTFLMFEFSVGASLQWVRVFNGCESSVSSVSASVNGCESSVSSVSASVSGCESLLGASL
jgi:hypothetical protein